MWNILVGASDALTISYLLESLVLVQMARLHLLAPMCLCLQLFSLVGTSIVPLNEQVISTRDLLHDSSYQLKRWDLVGGDAETHALHQIPVSLGGNTLLIQP